MLSVLGGYFSLLKLKPFLTYIEVLMLLGHTYTYTQAPRGKL